jgi:hypothetical protein
VAVASELNRVQDHKKRQTLPVSTFGILHDRASRNTRSSKAYKGRENVSQLSACLSTRCASIQIISQENERALMKFDLLSCGKVLTWI